MCDGKPQRADRDYVRMLHLAASTSESEVEIALGLLLDQAALPSFDAVRDLVRVPVAARLPAARTRRGGYGRLRPFAGDRSCLRCRLELRAMLRTLHLSGMADTFADLAIKAATAHLTYETLPVRSGAVRMRPARTAPHRSACCGNPDYQPRRPSARCSSIASR